MTGLQSNKCVISFNDKSDIDLSNDLDLFYNCFNIQDFSEELTVFKNVVGQNSVEVNRDKVVKLFQHVKERKCHGPNEIGGHILKNCAEQLADFSVLSF